MLEDSARQIADRVGDAGLVLDVGGGARPFARADWVLDIMPYQARGALGRSGDRTGERFGPESWVTRDICDRERWPFADGQFDFAVCAHTLEDVRDPIWVAQELQRVARAGYIEVPSLREELTYGINGSWVGWSHHRWLAFVEDGGIEFLFKHHVVNRSGSHLPSGAVDGLPPEARVQVLWWEGEFDVRERFIWTADDLDALLERLAAPAPAGNSRRRLTRPGDRLRRRFRRRSGSQPPRRD